MLIDKGNGTIGAAAKMSTTLPVWRIKGPTLRLLDILLVHVQPAHEIKLNFSCVKTSHHIRFLEMNTS